MPVQFCDVGSVIEEETGIIETWLPLFLFGILFGLSMDYHMLLLNRIKEEYDKHDQNELAVATGIRLTAGQITSAAAVMVDFIRRRLGSGTRQQIGP